MRIIIIIFSLFCILACSSTNYNKKNDIDYEYIYNQHYISKKNEQQEKEINELKYKFMQELKDSEEKLKQEIEEKRSLKLKQAQDLMNSIRSK
jgi:uncharacterized protein with gpF-like domain